MEKEKPEKTVTKLEYWRVRHNLSYADVARLLGGISRQYAAYLCNSGVSGAEMVVRIGQMTNNVVRAEDLIQAQDREDLVKEGLIKPSKGMKLEDDLEI